MTPNRPAVRILIVDDEPPILDLLRDMLEPEGYEIVTALDGARAWEELQRGAFDVIITDFRMPRMSGRELYDAARKAYPGIERRFVFISGEMDPTTKREFIHQTGAPVISKPFRAEAVRTVVRTTLETCGPAG